MTAENENRKTTEELKSRREASSLLTLNYLCVCSNAIVTSQLAALAFTPIKFGHNICLRLRN